MAAVLVVVTAVTAAAGVSVVDGVWRDTARGRDVPWRAHVPDGEGRCPVIVFSHGLGGTREGYAYLGKAWAEAGWLSVHLQHHGSDDAVWKEAGRRTRDVMEALKKAAADPANLIDRPMDVSFALDQLARESEEGGSVGERADLGRVAVGGHSFGAYTALAVAGQTFQPPRGGKAVSLGDPRVKAAVVLSAPGRDTPAAAEGLADIDVPLWLMTGTEDTSPIGGAGPEDRRLPFEHATGVERWLVVFKGGDHMVFSGRDRRRAKKTDAAQQAAVASGTTAFLKAVVLGDAEARAWLLEPDGYASTLAKGDAYRHAVPR